MCIYQSGEVARNKENDDQLILINCKIIKIPDI